MNYRNSCSCHQKGMKECKCGYPQPKPAQQLPTKTMPAKHQPVNQNSEFVGQDVIVPVVHPTHTTQNHHTTYKYMHSYPHTQSVVNSVSHEHYCVCPPKQHHGCKPKKNGLVTVKQRTAYVTHLQMKAFQTNPFNCESGRS